MASSALDDQPRHRSAAPRSTRSVWTVVAALVVVGAVAAIVISARNDRSSGDRDPLITLGRSSQVDPRDDVSGVLTLTDSCLSVPAGLVVWPVGSTWDAANRVVQVSHPAVQWAVGQGYGLPGTVMRAIPTTPTAVLPQSTIDALVACSRTTGIRTVAFVG